MLLCFPRWESTPWTACSSSCGGGIQSRSVSCVEEDIQGHISPVEEWKCMYTPKMPVVQPCNIFDCPKWLAQEWSPVINLVLLVFYLIHQEKYLKLQSSEFLEVGTFTVFSYQQHLCFKLCYLSNCKVTTWEKYINKMNMSKENDGKINQLCNINL